jgi:hypothetical protein
MSNEVINTTVTKSTTIGSYIVTVVIMNGDLKDITIYDNSNMIQPKPMYNLFNTNRQPDKNRKQDLMDTLVYVISKLEESCQQ